MPQHVCNRCGWIFSRKSNLNQHLTNRKKSCKPTNVVATVKNNYLSPPYNVPAVPAIKDRSPMLSRSPDISTLNVGIEKKAGSTNPKIKSLLDEIMNDSSTTDKLLATIPQAIPKNILPLQSPAEAAAVDVLPLSLVKSKPRTKGEIVGFSDGDSIISDDSDSDESIHISD